jgi:predicted nucleotide-binding protein (sugar kinase/HSP70/actin superfamily)
MGQVYLAAKGLLDDLGVEVIIPPPITKKTLEIGTRLSPEMACLPLKINIGNYIESIQRGTDTILLSGSCGPCRFGYYGVVQKEILNDLGYDIDIIIFDPPDTGYREFIQRIKRVAGRNSWLNVARAFKKASIIVEEADELLEIGLKKRAREANSGETDSRLYAFEREVIKCYGSYEILETIRKYKGILESIEEKTGVFPLKVGLVGEIYTLIEPFVNLNIEKKLGRLGVEVYRSLTLNEWVKIHLSLDMGYRLHHRRILKKAEPYLGLCVGGHAWQTVANSIHFSQNKLDGIIQVMPFGCMPEIVAESILPRVYEDYGVPIMTLVVDEMTGEAGYFTRLEAFIDLLEQRRNRTGEKKPSLSGG